MNPRVPLYRAWQPCFVPVGVQRCTALEEGSLKSQTPSENTCKCSSQLQHTEPLAVSLVRREHYKGTANAWSSSKRNDLG